ncbi:MAG TPA: hypothetical protein VF121_10475, partial [Thermoanaerobaculia bacterium]|nr:hypothetical protein [Thermoanaerobaculia bacterium]
TVRLDLRGVSGTLEAHWFDPRLGTFQSGQLFAGGTTRDLTAPGSGDWALRVRRTGTATPPVQAVRFFTLTPCRVYDSRLAGLRQPLRDGETRRVPAAGVCGIPATARALAVNVTAISPSGALSLAIWPSTLSRAQANVLSFAPYRTRGNNTFLMFGGGELSLEAGVFGTVHVALDVNGYFQ